MQPVLVNNSEGDGTRLVLDESVVQPFQYSDRPAFFRNDGAFASVYANGTQMADNQEDLLMYNHSSEKRRRTLECNQLDDQQPSSSMPTHTQHATVVFEHVPESDPTNGRDVAVGFGGEEIILFDVPPQSDTTAEVTIPQQAEVIPDPGSSLNEMVVACTYVAQAMACVAHAISSTPAEVPPGSVGPTRVHASSARSQSSNLGPRSNFGRPSQPPPNYNAPINTHQALLQTLPPDDHARVHNVGQEHRLRGAPVTYHHHQQNHQMQQQQQQQQQQQHRHQHQVQQPRVGGELRSCHVMSRQTAQPIALFDVFAAPAGSAVESVACSTTPSATLIHPRFPAAVLTPTSLLMPSATQVAQAAAAVSLHVPNNQTVGGARVAAHMAPSQYPPAFVYTAAPFHYPPRVSQHLDRAPLAQHPHHHGQAPAPTVQPGPIQQPSFAILQTMPPHHTAATAAAVSTREVQLLAQFLRLVNQNILTQEAYVDPTTLPYYPSPMATAGLGGSGHQSAHQAHQTAVVVSAAAAAAAHVQRISSPLIHQFSPHPHHFAPHHQYAPHALAPSMDGSQQHQSTPRMFPVSSAAQQGVPRSTVAGLLTTHLHVAAARAAAAASAVQQQQQQQQQRQAHYGLASPAYLADLFPFLAAPRHMPRIAHATCVPPHGQHQRPQPPIPPHVPPTMPAPAPPAPAPSPTMTREQIAAAAAFNVATAIANITSTPVESPYLAGLVALPGGVLLQSAAAPTAGPNAPGDMNPLIQFAMRALEVPHGLSKAELDSLPKRCFSHRVLVHPNEAISEETEKQVETVEETTLERCMICLDDYDEGALLRQLRCHHEFHVDCVDKWLRSKRTCPLCRADAADGSQPETNAPNMELYHPGHHGPFFL